MSAETPTVRADAPDRFLERTGEEGELRPYRGDCVVPPGLKCPACGWPFVWYADYWDCAHHCVPFSIIDDWPMFGTPRRKWEVRPDPDPETIRRRAAICREIDQFSLEHGARWSKVSA